MVKRYQCALFVFRRDLRVADNSALAQALEKSAVVVPLFIFDPRQIGDDNPYRGEHCMRAMLESLKDLERQLRAQGGELYYFFGRAEKAIERLLATVTKIDALFFNCDYTPFSRKRDAALRAAAKARGVAVHTCHDALLTNPEEVFSAADRPYRLFTPFYRHCRAVCAVSKPIALPAGSFLSGQIPGQVGATFIQELSERVGNAHVRQGGRQQAEVILRSLQKHGEYRNTHDMPEFPTTGLSVHLKFGTVSVRECYHAIVARLGSESLLIRSLYWRDFFTYIAYHFPQVFDGSFNAEYARIAWSKSRKNFERWCSGTTGFPIVDAGMRQLNQTGYMHNRVRMIAASFLVKDLHIDWRWGERYFAQQEVDYDPSINNGNWQWIASTGVDAQPYFRVMNPWLQQKRYDPDCHYIEKWVPELAKLSDERVHGWYREKNRAIDDYPAPMLDHQKEAKKAIEYYRKAMREKIVSTLTL